MKSALSVAALALAAAVATAGGQDGAAVDRVTTDAAGHEVSRFKSLPGGGTEITRTSWSGKTKQAAVTETADAAGRVVRRVAERYDDKGRLLDVRSVDIDASGHERGSRTIYAYDGKGSQSKHVIPVE